MPLLQTWINLNPSMEKYLHLYKVLDAITCSTNICKNIRSVTQYVPQKEQVIIIMVVIIDAYPGIICY